MGKTKSAKPSKEASTPRKAAGVTKASQAPKAVSKDMAKSAAKAIEKSKKKVKEVKPASSSEEDSDDSDSDSSESEEEKVPAKKASKAKATNGKVVKGKKAVASSSESSDSSDSDSDEEMTAPKAATNGKANDSDSDSSDSSDSDSEEAAKPAKAKTNGKKVVAAPVADEDSSDSSDSSDEETEAKADSKSSDEDSDDSDSDDSDAEVETKAVEEAPKKRKFEDAEEDTSAKKAKTDGPAEGSTLWAGQLSWNVDDEWLKQEFTACEGLVSARVVTDRETGRSRGFGFIDFSSPEGAKAALEAMNGKEIDGRGIKLDIAPARNNDGPKPRDRAQDRANKHGDVVSPESSTLFVGNIPFGITQNEVWEFFGDGVEVKNVRLPTNPESGELKGFGYVEFNSVEDAKSAFESKNGAMLGPGRAARALRLDYAQARDDSAPRGGGRGGGGGFGGRGGGRGRGGFGDRGGRGGGRGGGGFRGGRGGFGDRGGRGGSRIDAHAGGSGSKITFDD